jgi:hypothetical protein
MSFALSKRQKVAMAKTPSSPRERQSLKLSVKTAVLTEAGFRCAVPTCRTILVLDLHHIWEVSAGGPDESWNLIALCPTCHALYTRGMIPAESIYVWKSMLVALSNAFDASAIDRLLFLEAVESMQALFVSGDGILPFSQLIAAGFVTYGMMGNNNNIIVSYRLFLTEKGKMVISAWKSGNQAALAEALAPASIADQQRS